MNGRVQFSVGAPADTEDGNAIGRRQVVDLMVPR
jgi:hypothetical protein